MFAPKKEKKHGKSLEHDMLGKKRRNDKVYKNLFFGSSLEVQ